MDWSVDDSLSAQSMSLKLNCEHILDTELATSQRKYKTLCNSLETKV